LSRYVLSPAAKADLEAIWRFGEAQWGPVRAELYVRDIQRAVETVSADPRRGRPSHEIRAGYSRFAVGVHMPFYRQRPNEVDIVRILHQRMDFERHL